MQPPVRIAMWSGPRNLSTAMMRAFENREDCAVVDEPFYAAYLAATGAPHPMRDAVLASQPLQPAEVIASLLGPVPQGRAMFYQKQLTHHMLPAFDVGWMQACLNAFLIRDPSHVLASYHRKRTEITLADIGIVRQAELFDIESQRLGAPPPVIDAADILQNPHDALANLCRALGIAFTPRMLHWPPGRRASDGVWAAHWYGAVERSTGFQPEPAGRPAAPLPPPLLRLAEEARAHYERLRRYSL